jgi:hypothetical protein
MAEENVRASRRELGRWIVLAALLVACLVAYFVYAPRVPPALRPILHTEEP